MSNNSIECFLNNLEKERNKISEYEIATLIKNTFEKTEDTFTVKCEAMAFDFSDDYTDKDSGWGTYYGPKFIFSNEDGTVTVYPSISEVDSYMIQYWEQRAENAHNPIFKSRYADLVWEFSRQITGKNPSHSIAHIVIDNNIRIAEEELYIYEINVIKKLERALDLAVSLKDSRRIEEVKQTIFKTEQNIAIDEKPGLWGFSYDLLYKKYKLNLSNDEINRIIEELEGRVERLVNNKTPDPWSVEAAVIRLGSFYLRQNNKSDVRRVLFVLKNEYEKQFINAAPMQIQGWLEHLHELFQQFQLSDDAIEIRKELVKIGPKVKGNLKTISTSIKITEEQIQQFTSNFVKGDIKVDSAKIAGYFIPRKDQAKEQLVDVSKKYPISFSFSTSLMDSEGRTVATIGPLEEDLEGNIIHLITQNLSIQSIFLRRVIERFQEYHELKSESLLALLMESPVFDEERRELILKGLEFYFEKDFISSMHILIPQIENAFRRLITLTGGTVLKPSKNGGFRVKLFGDILNDSIIESVFGEDAKLYFKVLFTDSRGFNLRNSICHGLSSLNTFNQSNADLVIHVLFCLSQIREA
ncbi:DUF4209 domain-containing protein [Neobacillus massiliamazoniensis]|uniref:DUF4209 domain-containing protein n=1 Tax=Neobacillus massiliamazoniensis TaxID=1499688 RepID=A0A0U1NRK0_9BACI|nr:DUF4209 domain-containing protein [Neobacillus massiliamazoniensis]CRK80378.1 hypothetical protein BN000_00261 [Neobacillus massiliamazoniensis]